MEFYSIASSSSGNCYYLKTGESRCLIDTGISCKKIVESLESVNESIEDINRIFITHEHQDHVKSLHTVCKRAKGATVYASKGTWECISERVQKERQVIVKSGENMDIDDIRVKPFRLSHDAKEPVGYKISCKGKSIVIVTDTGCITEEIFENLINADLIVIESNHEENILRMGRYPYSVQQRILSEYGHLSNVTTGDCLCNVIKASENLRTQILLAHISDESNTKEQAYITVKNILEEASIFLGSSISIDVVQKSQLSKRYTV